MRNVVLFIAMSLDGYIADGNGRVDWLMGQDEDAETADSYMDFVKTIDTVIMGWRTYHQVTTELSPGEWVYENLQSYVITHRACPSADNITFTSAAPCSLVEKLKAKEGKDIWICGGADIIRQLMEQNLIDMYRISVIPIILGDGIRLFPHCGKEIKLRLAAVSSSNGITELIYQKNVEANAKKPLT